MTRRAFGEAGWHVVIHHGGSQAEAEALAAELPSAECVQCDLADGDAAGAMAEALAGRLGDWRVLVNCAAIFREDTAQALDPALFAETMQVNAASPVRLAQIFLAKARAKGGRRETEFVRRFDAHRALRRGLLRLVASVAD